MPELEFREDRAALISPGQGSEAMTIFDRRRLTDATFQLDTDRMRRGWYSDKYFGNITTMLTQLAEKGYRYQGDHPRLDLDLAREVEVGEMEVEMQWFTRRPGTTVVAGVDKALAMLRHGTGSGRVPNSSILRIGLKYGLCMMEPSSTTKGILWRSSQSCGCGADTGTSHCSKPPPWGS